jgi:anaerobic ribonucleoside-triphosphate reductase activating protein
MKLNLFQFTPTTEVEGPGVRACIQVQGCPIRCTDCGVPQTWQKRGGTIVDSTFLIKQILEGPLVEGVTFLGGEPFAQATALADIARNLKNNGLSVVTFTGYTLEFLQDAKRQDYDELLKQTDLLIDGPFQKDNMDMSRPWVGSRNQRYHFLTTRYLHLAGMLDVIPNRIEVRLKPDGSIFVSGLGQVDDMQYLIKNKDNLYS